MKEWCGHSIFRLEVIEGPPYSVYCSECKDTIAAGVLQCLQNILYKAKDAQSDANERIAALEKKIDDLEWKTRDPARD